MIYYALPRNECDEDERVVHRAVSETTLINTTGRNFSSTLPRSSLGRLSEKSYPLWDRKTIHKLLNCREAEIFMTSTIIRRLHEELAPGRQLLISESIKLFITCSVSVFDNVINMAVETDEQN